MQKTSKIVSEMLKIANEFDNIGLYKEADEVTRLIEKIAQVAPGLMERTVATKVVEGLGSKSEALNWIKTYANFADRPEIKSIIKSIEGRFPGVSRLAGIASETGEGAEAVGAGEAGGAAVEGAVAGAAAGGLMAAATIVVSTFLASYGITRFIMSHTGADKWVTQKFYNLLKTMGYSDSKMPNKQQMMAIAQQNKTHLMQGADKMTQTVNQSMQQGAAGALNTMPQAAGAR